MQTARILSLWLVTPCLSPRQVLLENLSLYGMPPTIGAIPLTGSVFQEGSLPVHLNVVSCNGTEEELLQCRMTGDPSTCSAFQDAGVVCQGM